MLAINLFNKLMTTTIEQMEVLNELQQLNASDKTKKLVAKNIKEMIDAMGEKSQKHTSFKIYYDNFTRVQQTELKLVNELLGITNDAKDVNVTTSSGE